MAGSISPASSPRRVGFSDTAAQALVEPAYKVQQRPVWSCCYPSTSTLRDPEAASLTRTHRGCYPSLGVIQGYTRNSLLSITPTYATGKNSEVNPLEDFRFPSTVVPGIERKRDFLIRPPPDNVCHGKQALRERAGGVRSAPIKKPRCRNRSYLRCVRGLRRLVVSLGSVLHGSAVLKIFGDHSQSICFQD